MLVNSNPNGSHDARPRNTHDRLDPVLIAGAGTIGQEIAVVCAHAGLEVRLFDTDPTALDGLCAVRSAYSEVMGHSADWREARVRILRELHVTTDLTTAAKDVELVIECIPEQFKLKRAFLEELSSACPAQAVIATNSSSILPSELAAFVLHPERFAAMHFNTGSLVVEVMGHRRTSLDAMTRLCEVAEAIGFVAIRMEQEHRGYVANALLNALNYTAMSLVTNGVAGVEDVDRAFIMVERSRWGPFGALDIVGLDTALNITESAAVATNDPQLKSNAALLRSYVERGELGIKSGRGFYEYPHPAYLRFGTRYEPALVEDEPCRPALIDSVYAGTGAAAGRRVFEAAVDPLEDGFLRDHVFKGTPLLPGAAVIELFAETSHALRPSATSLSFVEVEFTNGVRCFSERPQRLFVEVNSAEGRERLQLFQEFRNRNGAVVDARRLCAEAVSTETASIETCLHHPAHVHSAEVVYGDRGANRLGKTMRALRHVQFGEAHGGGEIVPDAPSHESGLRAGRHWEESIPVIDAAFVCCNLYTQWRYYGWWQLPVSIERLTLFGCSQKKETMTVEYSVRQLTDEATHAVFDLRVFDANRELVLDVEGYRCLLMRRGEGLDVTLRGQVVAQ